MAPEYGATIGFFPVDHQTLDYLRLTNRPPEQIALVEAYAKEQACSAPHDSPDPEYSDTLELDLATVVPSHGRSQAAAGSHQSAGREEEFSRYA